MDENEWRKRKTKGNIFKDKRPSKISTGMGVRFQSAPNLNMK